jgi:hypothetical protein
MRTIRVLDEDGNIMGRVEIAQSGRYASVGIFHKTGDGGMAIALDELEMAELIKELSAELADMKERNGRGSST